MGDNFGDNFVGGCLRGGDGVFNRCGSIDLNRFVEWYFLPNATGRIIFVFAAWG